MTRDILCCQFTRLSSGVQATLHALVRERAGSGKTEKAPYVSASSVLREGTWAVAEGAELDLFHSTSSDLTCARILFIVLHPRAQNHGIVNPRRYRGMGASRRCPERDRSIHPKVPIGTRCIGRAGGEATKWLVDCTAMSFSDNTSDSFQTIYSGKTYPQWHRKRAP
jgi:hypothetical protein